jgi:hypothetical protein
VDQRATFCGIARFNGATFTGDTGLDDVRVWSPNDPKLNKDRVWPAGWTVGPDPDTPTEGKLVRTGPAEGTASAAPPAGRPADNGIVTG